MYNNHWVKHTHKKYLPQKLKICVFGGKLSQFTKRQVIFPRHFVRATTIITTCGVNCSLRLVDILVS